MKCQYIFGNFDENKNLHIDDCERPGMAARGVPDKRGPVHIPVLRIKSPYEFPHRRLDFQKSFGARDGLHRGSLQNRRANIARMCG